MSDLTNLTDDDITQELYHLAEAIAEHGADLAFGGHTELWADPRMDSMTRRQRALEGERDRRWKAENPTPEPTPAPPAPADDIPF